MSTPLQLWDSLVSFLSGMGVSEKDKTVATYYSYTKLEQVQLENAYRGDWIARKLIQIPAHDSTRMWREWQAEAPDIETLEEHERVVCVKEKLTDALIKARLYGGAALLIGVEGAGSMQQELDIERVAKDSLKFLHVLCQQDLAHGDTDYDISSPTYGQPLWYTARTQDSRLIGLEQRIHPSRIVKLIGNDSASTVASDGAWGDSVLDAVNMAVINAGITMQTIAQLITEAKVDFLKVEDLRTMLGTTDATNRAIDRFSRVNAAKSVTNTVLMDKEEEWQRIQVHFAGMPEVMNAYLLIVCGAADIPATRFLGKSPDGLNATGDSDIRNYYDRIKADQESKLTPAMDTLDEVIIRSALGKRPEDIWYQWRTLWQMDEKQKAEILKIKAEATKVVLDTGLVQFDALVAGFQNMLVEDGSYPGLETAIAEAEAAGDFVEEVEEPDPLELAKVQAEAAAASGTGGGAQPPPRGNGGAPAE